MDDRPRYMITVAAELVGMHPQTLRVYETKGLVRPRRTPGNTRLYSEADLDRLRLIQRLTTELGLNLAGVETVLRLEDELGRLRARMERLEPRCARRSSASTASTAARSCSTATRTRHSHDQQEDMDFNRLTIKSQEAVGAAQELARRSGNPEIYPEHLVLALLDQELPRTLVERAGASVADVRARAEAALSAKPSVQGAAAQQPRVSTAFARGARPRRGGDAQARGRLRLDRAPPARARRRPARRAPRRAEGGARLAARHLAGSRGLATRRWRSSAAT